MKQLNNVLELWLPFSAESVHLAGSPRIATKIKYIDSCRDSAQNRTEQNRTEHNITEYKRTEQNRTDQIIPKQDRTEQITEQNTEQKHLNAFKGIL